MLVLIRLICGLAAAAVVHMASGSAVAQTYPDRPITVIVPFPPGASTDAVARLTRDVLAGELGQPVVIDESSVTVAIEDNGVGFDVADVERPGKRRGLGLLSIRERVAGLRGVVRIVSTPRHGSRIEVELPAVPPPRLHGLDAQLVASLMDPEVNRG